MSIAFDAVRRVTGIYAFVALDLLRRDFLAGRDPMGVKPLYLIQSERGLLFSSEIRPLLEATHEGDVLLLPPGHILDRAGCYYLRPTAPEEARWSGSDRELDQRLCRAVALRVPPDIPFAIMFSGGIDSTLVAHYARQGRPDAPAYFLGDPSAPDYAFAAEYADLVGMDLRRCDSTLEPTAERIRTCVAMSESYEPDVVRAAFCTSEIAGRIRQDGYKVALSGEGADELFAGYPPLEIVFAADEPMGRNVREQYLETMHRSNLQRLDRGGMAHQVEIREPFLDADIVSYARSLTATALVSGTGSALRGKAPLRRLYDLHPSDLPKSIRDRRKAPLTEGAGLEPGSADGPWTQYAETMVSDREFEDGRRRREAYDLRTKEEYLYLETRASTMDISRVPHLQVRHRIVVPNLPGLQPLAAKSGAFG